MPVNHAAGAAVAVLEGMDFFERDVPLKRFVRGFGCPFEKGVHFVENFVGRGRGVVGDVDLDISVFSGDAGLLVFQDVSMSVFHDVVGEGVVLGEVVPSVEGGVDGVGIVDAFDSV